MKTLVRTVEKVGLRKLPFNYTALVLILLISHAAMSLHAVTHAASDQTACELCAGHANPAHAIVTSFNSLLPVAAACERNADFFVTVETPAEIAGYHPRAPPALT